MQERYLREGGIRTRSEAAGQVFVFVGGHVAHTRNVANHLSCSSSDLYQGRVPSTDDRNSVGPILSSRGKLLARVVVPSGVDDWNARLCERSELLQQETLGLEREGSPIEEITRDKHRIHLLGDSGIQAACKRLAQALTQPVPYMAGPGGEGRI